MPSFAAIPLNESWAFAVGAIADGFPARWLLGVCAGFCATAAEYIASASPQTSAVLVHNLDVTFMNVPPVWVLAPRTARRRDRKSTRLNSSHSQISYAVFCLKKKKRSILILRIRLVSPSSFYIDTA